MSRQLQCQNNHQAKWTQCLSDLTVSCASIWAGKKTAHGFFLRAHCSLFTYFIYHCSFNMVVLTEMSRSLKAHHLLNNESSMWTHHVYFRNHVDTGDVDTHTNINRRTCKPKKSLSHMVSSQSMIHQNSHIHQRKQERVHEVKSIMSLPPKSGLRRMS